MSRKKILASGSIVIENQFFVENIPQLNEVALSNKKALPAAASKVVNGCRLLTKSNEVFLLSAIGKDDKGKKAIDLIKEYGFKTQLIQTTKNNSTGEVIVLTDNNGQSAITVYLGAGRHIKPEKKLNQYDAFYLDTSIPLQTLYYILKNKPQNKPCLLDLPNKHQQFDKKMLKYATFFIPNRFEAQLLLNSEIKSVKQAFGAAKKIQKFCPHNIIITLDEEGCIIVNQQTEQHIPACKTKVVDATGAGDIFRGTFFNQYLRNSNILESLELATKIAAYSVSIAGLDQSIKTIKKKFGFKQSSKTLTL